MPQLEPAPPEGPEEAVDGADDDFGLFRDLCDDENLFILLRDPCLESFWEST